jgi:hypothetical protein
LRATTDMIEAIATEFEGWLRRILAAASRARRCPAEWEAIRRTWVPGGHAAAAHVGDAAHPSAVREVLVALEAAYAARLPPEHPDESEAMWDFRHRTMLDFVRSETDAYIARVTPRPDVGSLFAQAAVRQAAQSRPPGPAEPSAAVRICTSCGAPRQSDTLYGNCAFCGTPFFPRST